MTLVEAPSPATKPPPSFHDVFCADSAVGNLCQLGNPCASGGL